jgi:hypothetical protein
VSEDKIVNFVQRLKEKRAALEEAAHEDQKQITARDREFDIAIDELFGGLEAIHAHFVKHASDDRDVVESGRSNRRIDLRLGAKAAQGPTFFDRKKSIRQRGQTLRDRQCGRGPCRWACGNRKPERVRCGYVTPTLGGQYKRRMAQRASKVPRASRTA